MLCQTGEVDRALPYLDQCLELEPHHGMALANRGAVYLEQDRPKEALADSEKACRLNPSDLVANWNLATALRQLNRLDEAVARYREFVVLGRGHPGWEQKVAAAEDWIASRQR